MLKIKKTADTDWLLCDFDFRSLQMCLAFADCAYNASTVDTVGYDMYNDSVMADRALGKELDEIDIENAVIGDNDAHSHTGYATFVESVNRELIEITNKSGKKFIFDPEQTIKVVRKNLVGESDTVEILGKDFEANNDLYEDDTDGPYTMISRRATLADFLKLKKKKPYSVIRTDSKSINFGAIFGCAGPSLAQQMKLSGFDEKKLGEAIKNLKLESVVNQAVLNRKPGTDPVAVKYAVVGTRIRELFFKLYPGLEERTLNEQKFAKTHGYIRDWTGTVYHTPELRYMKKSAAGEVVSNDKRLYGGMFSHACNNATNSPIQTAEVYQAMPDAVAMFNFIKKLGLRSRLFNYVHDSQEDYVFKIEEGLIKGYYNYLASIARQPYFNVPMHIDMEASDPDKNEIFRAGREINIEKVDIKAELKKWCELFNRKVEWEEIDAIRNKWIPLHGVIEGGHFDKGKHWYSKACSDPKHTWEIQVDGDIKMYGIDVGDHCDYFKKNDDGTWKKMNRF